MDARDPVWWGNLLMIFIESTTVLLLLASYFYCWRNEPQWPPPLANQPAFHQPLPSFKASTANLIVMLGTCITMYLTDKAARQMRHKGVLIGLWFMFVVSIITISDKSLSESGIKLLSVDGVAPTKQNLQSAPIRSAVRSTLSRTRSW